MPRCPDRFSSARRLAAALTPLLLLGTIRAQDLTLELQAESPASDMQQLRVRRQLQHTTPAEIGPILEEVVNDRDPLDPDSGSTFSAESDPDTASLLLSGSPAQVEQATELVSRLDVAIAPDSTMLQVVELTNLRAEEAAASIRERIRQKYGPRARTSTADGSDSEDVDVGVSVQRTPQVIADPERNMLMFQGRPSDLVWIEHQIQQLERRAGRKDPVGLEDFARNNGFEVEVVDGIVRLRLIGGEGASVEQFLRLSERLLEVPIRYHPAEVLEDRNRIAFHGTIAIELERFREVFDSILFGAGFGCIEVASGDSILFLETILLSGPQRNRVAMSARLVDEQDLERYRTYAATTITVLITFEHVDPATAVAQTRPFFASTGNVNFSLAPVGKKSMLVSGFGTTVFHVVQIMKQADRAEVPTPGEGR